MTSWMPTNLRQKMVAFNLESLIAHLDYQVRTPLNGVIGYSEILLENAAEQGREKIAADLQKIHAAGKLSIGAHQQNR